MEKERGANTDRGKLHQNKTLKKKKPPQFLNCFIHFLFLLFLFCPVYQGHEKPTSLRGSLAVQLYRHGPN